MFAQANLSAISPVIPPAFTLSTLLVPAVFNKYKNLVLRTFARAISRHIITDNVINI